MKVLTLRTAKTLPTEYQGLPEFTVRIAGETTVCKTLADAQRATAYCPQDATVTLSKVAADGVRRDAK